MAFFQLSLVQTMPRLLKIDPYLETIYAVDVADSLTSICRQIGARRLTIAGRQSSQTEGMQGGESSDAAYCDEEAIQADLLPPAFRLRTSGHIIFGCALWHRVTEQGELKPSALSISELSAQIEFLGFQPVPGLITDITMLDDENLPLDAPDDNSEPF